MISKTALATATAAFAFGMNGVFGDGQGSGSSSVSCSASGPNRVINWTCASGNTCAATCTDLGDGYITIKVGCCPSTATDIEDCSLSTKLLNYPEGPCSSWSLPSGP